MFEFILIVPGARAGWQDGWRAREKMKSRETPIGLALIYSS